MRLTVTVAQLAAELDGSVVRTSVTAPPPTPNGTNSSAISGGAGSRSATAAAPTGPTASTSTSAAPDRITEAHQHCCAGEAEGFKVSLAAATAKLIQLDELAARQAAAVDLGIAGLRPDRQPDHHRERGPGQPADLTAVRTRASRAPAPSVTGPQKS